MAHKNSRAGGKFGGTHTTLSAAAALLMDEVARSPYVTKISPGYLRAGLRPAHGKRRVKIVNEGSRILLSIRDNITEQQVHVFASDIARAITDTTSAVRALGWQCTHVSRTD